MWDAPGTSLPGWSPSESEKLPDERAALHDEFGAGALSSVGEVARAVRSYASATFRSILAYAVADGRITVNAAASAKQPSGGQGRRDGIHLTVAQLHDLAEACAGRYVELVLVLGLGGVLVLLGSRRHRRSSSVGWVGSYRFVSGTGACLSRCTWPAARSL